MIDLFTSSLKIVNNHKINLIFIASSRLICSQSARMHTLLHTFVDKNSIEIFAKIDLLLPFFISFETLISR